MSDPSSSASAQPDSAIVLQPSNSTLSHALSQDLSPEETYVLFAALQQAADELRKMKHAKHQEAARP
jgi:hypothetical protein